MIFRLLLRILVSLLFVALRNRLMGGSRRSSPSGEGPRVADRGGRGGKGPARATPPLDRGAAMDVPFTEIPPADRAPGGASGA